MTGQNNNEKNDRRRKEDPTIDLLKTNLEDLDGRFKDHANETKQNFKTIQNELKEFSKVVTPIVDIAKALKWFRAAVIYLTPIFVAWQIYLEIFK